MSITDRIRLQYEVEQFLYLEASLLDSRRYEEWLNLLTEDIHYWMPIRRTTTLRQVDREFTKPGDMAFFDDNLDQLRQRVTKLTAGNAWSEDPPSRTRHYVANVRILEEKEPEVIVECSFHLYRTRLDSEEDSWRGRRVDTLRRVDGEFRIARREIYLDQTVILSQNMSNVF